ncbi:MAG: hypothetical protein ACYDAG_09260 [Chloroflexota bacterium]
MLVLATTPWALAEPALALEELWIATLAEGLGVAEEMGLAMGASAASLEGDEAEAVPVGTAVPLGAGAELPEPPGEDFAAGLTDGLADGLPDVAGDVLGDGEGEAEASD